MRGLTRELQRAIEEVYRLQNVASIEDFCASRDVLAAFIDDERESLLVHHDGVDTHLSLFIADDVLHGANAFARRDSGQLDEFCVATEGVSHFVYFTFCGEALERPVSQIELELQAEIDKYIVLRFVCGDPRDDLLKALFDAIQIDAKLSAHERERYALANQSARRYSRWLEARFQRGDGAIALADARTLYRKPLAEKLEHIARAA